MLSRLQTTLKQRQLLPKNGRILIAVSGGQDSLCLLKLLLELQPKWGWDLAVAHCDHRWKYDVGLAEHVAAIVQNWQVTFYLKTAVAVSESEGAARQWRYQALIEVAQAHRYEYVVTAHTKSDRAETFLYNLMRGSGADGLQALTWRRQLTDGIYLVRPLLEITRAQTGEYCQTWQLPVWEDVYNQDFKYARNRIRQELLPYLKSHFNPQVEQALAQTSELLRADVEYLEQQAQQLLEQALEGVEGVEGAEGAEGAEGVGEWGSRGVGEKERDKGDKEDISYQSTVNSQQSTVTSQPSTVNHQLIYRLNRRVLRSAPLALQRRAMRLVLQQILPSAPSFEHIEKLTALITAPNRSQTDPFPGGAIAQVDGNWINLSRS